jgi:CHAT domain-containing protein
MFNLHGICQENDDQDSLQEKFLVINSFDAMSMDARKNKKELFAQLADSLKKILSGKLEPTYKELVIIYPDRVPATDSNIFSLMTERGASTAIVIKNIDVHFEKTGVEVTGEKGNKERTVSFDICSAITYALYDADEKIKESEVNLCEAYTERSAFSGLLAVGPDIVGKRKDAFRMLTKNVDKLFLSPDIPRLYGNFNVQRKPNKIKKGDTVLKYSLSFAGQSQLMHDGLRLRTYINQSFAESGDVSYYNGKYFNSKMRYLHALRELPGGGEGTETEFATLIKQNTEQRDIDYIKAYTRIITSSGMLFQTRGKFVMAEKLMSSAMDMRKRWLGENSEEYLNSLHNMAVLKKEMGLYDEAESSFNKLMPVFKQTFGDSSLEYITVLNNKAMLLAELGRTKDALELLDQALRIGAVKLSPAYFDYERILTNKALLEHEVGDFNKAETDYTLAISNMEKKGFEDHPDYNNMLMYYGSLKAEKMDLEALSFLSKIKDKVKKRYGDEHPLFARALANEAEYYLNKSSFAEARDIYKRIVNIQSKTLGEKHKDYLNSLVKLAVCQWQLRDVEAATTNFTRAINNYLFLVSSLFGSMSESEKTNFWRVLKPDIDTYMAFVAETWRSKPSLLKEAYDVQLRTKGILINSTMHTRAFIHTSGDPGLKSLYDEWLNLKHDLAAYYSSPVEDANDDKVDLQGLEQKANEVEKELSKLSSRFSSVYRPAEVTSEDVKAKLNKNELAMEIIRVFHYYGEKKGESEYIALVLNKDSLVPVITQIGNGAGFEQMGVMQYKSAIRNKTTDTASYRIYWKPLAPASGDYKTIYISVDGVYNSINLNTIRSSDGSYVIDQYRIVLVPSTRSVATGLQSKIQLPTGGSEALLLGFPDYGNDEIIPPLPETKEEVQQIDELLSKDHVNTKVLIGQHASEENIKSLVHPSILHVATHGFFHSNVNLAKSMNMGVRVSRAKDNALLRSGLLFNGAAVALSKEPVLDASNNGILYAYEAMNLDLKGTNLVVLSACETGIGEIMNGEGVFGLSRAFQVAGADKIIMSLWKVEDKATKELMILLYKNWLQSKDIQQAFIEAQKQLRTKYPQPYYWGGFVLLN